MDFTGRSAAAGLKKRDTHGQRSGRQMPPINSRSPMIADALLRGRRRELTRAKHALLPPLGRRQRQQVDSHDTPSRNTRHAGLPSHTCSLGRLATQQSGTSADAMPANKLIAMRLDDAAPRIDHLTP